jgi:predicted HTH transcriptional regulator
MPILNDKLEKEVVSFLNSESGGEILIGISYEGVVLGVDAYDTVIHSVFNRIRSNISPNCLGLFDVYAEEISERHIIRIIVSRGTEKPYYITLYGMNSSGCTVRVGTEVRQMGTETIKSLQEARSGASLSRIISPRNAEHTFAQLKIYYEERGFRTDEGFLANLGFYTPEKKLNYIAFLFTDSNNISIKVSKYSGTDKSEIFESEEYGFCSLPKSAYRVLDKLEVENRTFTQVSKDGERTERKLIDREALKEAVINAIIHNDYTRDLMPFIEIYSDRITITSFGGLPEGLTREDFFNSRSMLRNREIPRIFRDIKLAGHMGTGIVTILKSYEKNIFNFTENSMEVIIPFADDYMRISKKQEKQGKVSFRTKDKILELIKSSEGNVTAESLALSAGVTKKAIEWHLKKLRDAGMIIHDGSRKTGVWKIRV